MNSNLIEELRKCAIEELFSTSFSAVWEESWRDTFMKKIENKVNGKNIFNMGDSLSELFQSTSKGRNQSSVSGGGYKWECLVCWYLNLCLIGTRTVVIKQKKNLVPKPLKEAIAVYYGNFRSDTEADLIAISFPNDESYLTNIDELLIRDCSGELIPNYVKNKINRSELLDFLIDRDFEKVSINIIQCKTNWNDNAQIPMLWDMIYSADSFVSNRIQIGGNGFSIKNLADFKYSFVTVPTNKEEYTPTKTAVQRVRNLSGGNFWGRESLNDTASSIKEIFNRNFKSSQSSTRLITNLDLELEKINTVYDYFKLG
ncbi:hypothetical protein BCR24_01580 [Enterococcus ureilyticus]|uniref:Restriction endonuclease n=2 Tax=Enterococcus ureilyticus TaxID=1131292 RepID=A0A1E5HHJ3_9ENTE|nr:hypothetical protein BCR24_01580 [Enterococcus ureilyticus]